ncbi:serpin-ZX-like [Chenopodium quinoa]|uniref:serpin-ZX-like n=1 Tax=Chenopodium quinoa TaxID=63459 RepID=UPI000B776BD6|nr:serpin-ZX-like [Chenopodium quinoa]
MDFCVDVGMHKLVKDVQSSDKPLENVVFSAFGMCVILNMIANGAKGATLHQLLHYIKLQSVDDLVTQASNLMQLAKSSGSDDNDDDLVICNFNAVLVKESITLNKNHQRFLEDAYQAKVKYVDFKRKDEAVAEVNAWVEQETKGLINKLYLNGAFNSPNLTLSHANGLYFNGKWENEFLESNSKMETFYPIEFPIKSHITMIKIFQA